MVARTPEENIIRFAAMLDDLWGVAFKLRNVLVLVETRLSGKDDAPTDAKVGGQERADTSARTDRGTRSAQQSGPEPPSAVPANPAGNVEVVVHTPPPSGGALFPSPDRYGEPVEEGTKLRYHAGPCWTCGRPVRRVGKPAPGASGTYRCWTCIKGARR